MSLNISQLPRLRRQSDQRLDSLIVRDFRMVGGGTRLFSIQRGGTGYVAVPRNGVRGLRSVRKIMTYTSSNRDRLTSLNQALNGGESYPALIFALGFVFVPLGTVGTIGGIIFSCATTAFDSSRRSTNVLAREGDEIWHVEEIGRAFEDNLISDDRWVATHISSYFLVDPFRRQNTEKGWLLHEERTTLEID